MYVYSIVMDVYMWFVALACLGLLVSDCDEDESEVRILKSDNVQHKPKQANQPRKVSENPRNFVPTAVLTKFGIVPVSAARPINTAAPKSFVNAAKTRPNAFQKSHSPPRRPFYQQTALKNINLNDKVNTTKVNFVNTAKGNRVISDVGEQGINVVKSSECQVWRPKINVLDHISKNSGSYNCKQFDYVDPTGLELKDKKELAIPGQTVTSKEFLNPLMADSLEKKIFQLSVLEGDLRLIWEGRNGSKRFTPTKVSQGEEQSQESSEVQLDVLSAAKILADASRERVKTYKSYTRRRRSTVSSRDGTAGGLFSTAGEILSTDERIAQKLNKEEMAKDAAREEQEMIDFEKALELQK
ncbi:hypothetical protein Tco_0683957 [Tanacetum coccineum]